MRDTTEHIKMGLYLSLSSILTAVAITVALNGSLQTFGLLWVLQSTTVLGAPLALTDPFTFPLWVWYVTVLNWMGQITVTLEYA